jgi:hypothetical protein
MPTTRNIAFCDRSILCFNRAPREAALPALQKMNPWFPPAKQKTPVFTGV